MFGDKKIKNIDLYYFSTDKRNVEDYDHIVSNYIKYYHFRARRCKVGFYFWSVMKLCLIALMPVIQAINSFENSSWIIPVCTSGLFLIESILEIWRFKEKWILYRDTCNRLTSIQRQFMGSTAEGIDDERLIYIGLVESLIEEEVRNWYEMSQKRTEEMMNQKKTKN